MCLRTLSHPRGRGGWSGGLAERERLASLSLWWHPWQGCLPGPNGFRVKSTSPEPWPGLLPWGLGLCLEGPVSTRALQAWWLQGPVGWPWLWLPEDI